MIWLGVRIWQATEYVLDAVTMESEWNLFHDLADASFDGAELGLCLGQSIQRLLAERAHARILLAAFRRSGDGRERVADVREEHLLWS